MANPTSKSARLTTTLDELAQLEIQTPNTPATSRATMNEDFLAQLDRMRDLSLREYGNRALPLTAQQIQQLSPFMTSIPVHRPLLDTLGEEKPQRLRRPQNNLFDESYLTRFPQLMTPPPPRQWERRGAISGPSWSKKPSNKELKKAAEEINENFGVQRLPKTEKERATKWRG